MAVTKTIDINAWQQNYIAGTGRSGQKLVSKFSSRSGMVDAATSPQAEQLMTQKVASPLALAKRRFKLKRAGDAGLIAGMQKTGAQNYQNNTAARAAKAAAGFQPFIQPLQTILGTLPARTADPAANVQNRVTPIAVGLNAAAKTLYGAQ